MINYPPETAQSRALLLRQWDDLDVFVEDTSCTNAYRRLLNRILEGKARVDHVIPLGGKLAVIKECARAQKSRGLRRQLFIIDGDFDLLLGRSAPALRRLYRLGVFSCENLLISRAAAHEVAAECLPDCDPYGIHTTLGFDSFLGTMIGLLKPLICVYAAVFCLDPDVETVGFSVMRLTERHGREVILSGQKVQQRINGLKDHLYSSFPKEKVDELLNSVDEALRNSGDNAFRLIPGKGYLLTLLLHHMSHKAGLRDSNTQFMVRLAQHCELDADPGLSIAVLQAATLRGR